MNKAVSPLAFNDMLRTTRVNFGAKLMGDCAPRFERPVIAVPEAGLFAAAVASNLDHRCGRLPISDWSWKEAHYIGGATPFTPTVTRLASNFPLEVLITPGKKTFALAFKSLRFPTTRATTLVFGVMITVLWPPR